MAGIFDFHPEPMIKKEWNIDAPIDEKEWSIGLIVGASGSGKTTIAKSLFCDNFHSYFNWKQQSSFIDDYDQSFSVEQITSVLSSVGFGSVPDWFLPYSCLSTGQQFRAELSRAVLENDFVVIDEFTSVVDRNVAMSASFAVSKYVRKNNKKFVAVTCHYDVEQYLQPDWVMDISKNTFNWGCLRRSEFDLSVRRAKKEEWELFRQHHYLNTSLNKASQCFIAELNNIPVAFTAVIHFPHPRVKNYKKEHRTVVLPDYQGLGIGCGLSEFVAKYYTDRGFRFTSVTSHPAMINHRRASDKWKLKRIGRMQNNQATKKQKSMKASSSERRYTTTFEYVR
jgi:ABC-type lipoprotein export system ATPase subunit/GNAT superfamily N-acetyltransferase